MLYVIWRKRSIIMNVKNIMSEKCYGCGLCMVICPLDCIKKKEDYQGLSYPEIDEEKCVHCGKCYRQCPVVSSELNKPKQIKAIKNTDDIRYISASGGAFTAIAQYIISHNGIVYGAAFDEKLNLKHIRCETMDDLKGCRGSKYLQSDIMDALKLIKKDIEDQRFVLFSGTPCQVSAVKNEYGSYDKIVLVDLICHGVIGKRIFQEFKMQLEKKYNSELKEINFRDKSKGWSNQRWSACLKNGRYIDEGDMASYKNLYYSHFAHRESCFHCQFANIERTGDITIGDYWGVGNYYPEINDEKGISLTLINTKRGEYVADQISVLKKGKILKENECMQPQLREAVSVNLKKRKLFNKVYRIKGYSSAIKVLFSNKIICKIIRKFF